MCVCIKNELFMPTSENIIKLKIEDNFPYIQAMKNQTTKSLMAPCE